MRNTAKGGCQTNYTMVVDVDMVPNAGDNLIKIVSHSSLTQIKWSVCTLQASKAPAIFAGKVRVQYLSTWRCSAQICSVLAENPSLLFLAHHLWQKKFAKLCRGNLTEGKDEWVSTIGLLIKETCFCKKVTNVFNIRRRKSKLVSTRWSTILSLVF